MVSQYKKNLSRLKSQLKYFSFMGTLIIYISFPVPVLATFLTNWFFDPDNNQLQFTLPEGTIPTYSVESKPTRLVVYIPDTKVSVDMTELYPAGLVRKVSLSQERSQQAKVVIDFASDDSASKRVLIDLMEFVFVIVLILTSASFNNWCASKSTQTVCVRFINLLCVL